MAADTDQTTLRSNRMLRQNQRSRNRQSINHLLNFTLPDRPSITSQSFDDHDRDTANYSSFSTAKPFRKEQFMNANFRFVLDPLGDYTQYMADPDLFFDWDSIQQILLYGNHMPSCPICLSTPVAARISRCGHIFCFSCIMRYFDMSTCKTWKECPICGDAIMGLKEVKSVKGLQAFSVTMDALESLEPNKGKKIDMCLVHRAQDTMFAFPWDIDRDTLTKPPIPWTDTPNAMLFSRFMLARDDYMQTEYTQNGLDLSHALAELDGHDPEEAKIIESCLEQIQHVLDQTDNTTSRNPPKGNRITQRTKQQSLKSKADTTRVPTDYYFFQAVDGQHIYLSSRTVRMLLWEFGEYRRFPKHIQGTITDVHESLFTEEARKRYKYLGHLPLGCTVIHVDIDLTGVVSKDTLEHFAKNVHPVEETPKEMVESEYPAEELLEIPSESALDHENKEQPSVLLEMDEDELIHYVMQLSLAEHNPEVLEEIEKAPTLPEPSHRTSHRASQRPTDEYLYMDAVDDDDHDDDDWAISAFSKKNRYKHRNPRAV